MNVKKLLEVKNIEKTYLVGEVTVPALRGVSLSIDLGDFVAIMGQSGSGKSTLMNLLGCLDRPTKGQYFIEGKDVSQLSGDELADMRNLKIGFIFQGFNLLSKASALENVELPLYYNRNSYYSAKEKAVMARNVLDAVGLSGRYHHNPKQLSGGQQQRVAIARALINNPSLLLADEPTGNLDSRTSVEIMKVFQELNQNNGITVILVTHSSEVADFAKRVVVFRDGKVINDYPVVNRLDAEKELEKLDSQQEA